MNGKTGEFAGTAVATQTACPVDIWSISTPTPTHRVAQALVDVLFPKRCIN